MDESKRFKAETTGLFAVRTISNCLLVVSFDAAFGMMFDLPPLLICISACEMLIYLVLAMLLRRRFRSFVVFCLVHFAGILLVTFGAPYMFYVHLISASWISAVALYDYISGRRMIYPGIGHVIYPFAIFIAGFTTGRENVILLAVLSETAFLILFMLRRNFESLDNVFITSSRYVRVPYEKMRRMNTFLAVTFVLASLLVAVILGLAFDGAKLIYLIGQGLVLVMAAIFIGLVWLFSHLFPNADNALAGGMAGGMTSFEQIMEEHPILMLLWHTFEFAAYAVAAGIMIYLIYRFVRDLYYEFRSAIPENGDKRIMLETREDHEETELRPRNAKPGFGREDRVRRRYIKLVRDSGRQKEITDSMTPMEIEAKIDRKELSELHDAYEKARYG
jgi:hypothetical protein